MMAAPSPSPTPRRLQALLRLIPSLREVRQRRLTMRSRLLTWTPAQLALVLERLAPLSAARVPRAPETALALGLAIIDLRYRGSQALIEAAHQAAAEHDLPLACALLASSPARRVLPPRGRPREVCIPARHPFALERGTVPRPRTLTHFGDVPVSPHYSLATAESIEAMDPEELLHWASLGKQVTHFGPMSIRAIRGLQPQFGLPIEKCVAHPDPVFIRRFLQQPWVQVQDVLQIASRRPLTPEVALQLVYNDRWFALEPVQHALLTNPFTPTEVVLPLLPCAALRTLDYLALQNDDSISQVATRLLQLRRARGLSTPS